MPTGFENAGRGRRQGRRARHGGNFGRRTRARNRDIRSEKNRLSQQSRSENVDDANSSVSGTINSLIARQTFMSVENNRARVLRELTGISDDTRSMMDGNFQEFMSHRREYLTLELIAEKDRVINRVRTAAARANWSREETEEAREKNRELMRVVRTGMSQEEADAARERNRQSMQDVRDREQRRFGEATACSFPAQQPRVCEGTRNEVKASTKFAANLCGFILVLSYSHLIWPSIIVAIISCYVYFSSKSSVKFF